MRPRTQRRTVPVKSGGGDSEKNAIAIELLELIAHRTCRGRARQKVTSDNKPRNDKMLSAEVCIGKTEKVIAIGLQFQLGKSRRGVERIGFFGN